MTEAYRIPSLNETWNHIRMREEDGGDRSERGKLEACEMISTAGKEQCKHTMEKGIK